ncbi:hypothetical protein EV701_10974 [Chthoniobacter flavus]|nr:hypothetical protein EV701_10974 [Chthoniobacter flavus]
MNAFKAHPPFADNAKSLLNLAVLPTDHNSRMFKIAGLGVKIEDYVPRQNILYLDLLVTVLF